MKKKLEKLDIDLFGLIRNETLQDEYNKQRAEFIANREKYVPGHSGLFSYKPGHYEKNPQLGEAEWNEKYPNGIESYKLNCRTLNSIGQQSVIDKINEIIRFVNKK